MQDHYACLGVSPHATSDEITRAFRQHALHCHPDRQHSVCLSTTRRGMVSLPRSTQSPSALDGPGSFPAVGAPHITQFPNVPQVSP